MEDYQSWWKIINPHCPLIKQVLQESWDVLPDARPGTSLWPICTQTLHLDQPGTWDPMGSCNVPPKRSVESGIEGLLRNECKTVFKIKDTSTWLIFTGHWSSKSWSSLVIWREKRVFPSVPQRAPVFRGHANPEIWLAKEGVCWFPVELLGGRKFCLWVEFLRFSHYLGLFL